MDGCKNETKNPDRRPKPALFKELSSHIWVPLKLSNLISSLFPRLNRASSFFLQNLKFSWKQGCSFSFVFDARHLLKHGPNHVPLNLKSIPLERRECRFFTEIKIRKDKKFAFSQPNLSLKLKVFQSGFRDPSKKKL